MSCSSAIELVLLVLLLELPLDDGACKRASSSLLKLDCVGAESLVVVVIALGIGSVVVGGLAVVGNRENENLDRGCLRAR